MPLDGITPDGELLLSLVLPDAEPADNRLEVIAAEMKVVAAENQ